MKSGVPQGTVLGPLLFSIYMNDIIDNIELEIRLFADDCVLYRTIKNSQDATKLQEDLEKLELWAEKWEMRFQPQKGNIMHMTKNKKTIYSNYYLKKTVLKLLFEENCIKTNRSIEVPRSQNI